MWWIIIALVLGVLAALGGILLAVWIMSFAVRAIGGFLKTICGGP